MKICSNLITLVDQNAENHELDEENVNFVLKKELRIAHYSVKEYIISERTSTSPFHISEVSAHTLIAERCIRYLLCHLAVSKELTRKYLMEIPFLEYAAINWYKHARAIPLGINDAELTTLIMQLFSNRYFHNWVRIWDPDREWGGILPPKRESVPPLLYYASLMGLFHATNKLVGKGVDVNPQGGFYGNALQAASRNGHEAVVRLLPDKGADVNEVMIS
jgi:hypothetical protein